MVARRHHLLESELSTLFKVSPVKVDSHSGTRSNAAEIGVQHFASFTRPDCQYRREWRFGHAADVMAPVG